MPYGFQSFVGVARQTAWGTPAAVASGDFIEALSESFVPTRARFDVRNLVGRVTEPDDVAGLTRIEGELVASGHPVSIGHLLNAAMGQGSRAITVVLSGFLWTLDWMPSPSDFSSLAPLPPYTLEVFRDVTSSHRFADAVATRIGFAVQPNQDVRVTLGMIAKTTSIIAKSTPTFPSSPTDPFTFDTASISIAGAASELVEGWTLTADMQMEGVPTLNNTTEIHRVRRRGPVMYRLAGTIGFENLTEYNAFIAQTEQRIVASFFRAQSFQLIFDLPRVVWSEFPVAAGGRERITAAFAGIARHHIGSGTPAAIKLTTTKSNF